MEQRNETSTAEIVATLRRGCLVVQRQAADRLELLERELAEANARAKKAEKERDKYKKLYKEADDALEECTI